MKVEFSREIAVDAIGTGGQDMQVVADVDERRKLAARFGWITIEALAADVHLSLRAGGVEASGRLTARVEQPCVSTGEPVAEIVDTDFSVRFVETALLGSGQDEVELGDDDLDVIEYEGRSIDVGEAVAQTLALNVEPYPRAATLEPSDGDRTVYEDAKPSAFGALSDMFKG